MILAARSKRQTWSIPLPPGSQPAEVQLLVNQDEQFMGICDVQSSAPVRIALQLVIARAKKKLPGGLKSPRRAKPFRGPTQTTPQT
jgi:hypothetical protein